MENNWNYRKTYNKIKDLPGTKIEDIGSYKWVKGLIDPTYEGNQELFRSGNNSFSEVFRFKNGKLEFHTLTSDNWFISYYYNEDRIGVLNLRTFKKSHYSITYKKMKLLKNEITTL